MSTTGKLRLAIVGLGKMGMLHWRTWQAIPDVELVAAIDTDARKASWSTGGVVANPRHSEDLLGHIDAAIIATPPDQHLPCALPLLDAGVHCLIEKPLALTLADSTQLITAAAMHHARLAVGHSERFNPAIWRARTILLEGLRSIEVFRMATPGADSQADIVHDLMVHDLDWLLDALDRSPEHIRILNADHATRSLSRVSCELLFPEGPVVRITASRIEKTRRRELILHGTRGETTRIDLDCTPFQAGKDPLTLQANAFIDLLRGKTSPIATGMEILPVMALGHQIREACLATEDSYAENTR